MCWWQSEVLQPITCLSRNVSPAAHVRNKHPIPPLQTKRNKLDHQPGHVCWWHCACSTCTRVAMVNRLNQCNCTLSSHTLCAKHLSSTHPHTHCHTRPHSSTRQHAPAGCSSSDCGGASKLGGEESDGIRQGVSFRDEHVFSCGSRHDGEREKRTTLNLTPCSCPVFLFQTVRQWTMKPWQWTKCFTSPRARVQQHKW